MGDILKELEITSLKDSAVTMVMNTLSTRSSCSLLKSGKSGDWGCTETLAYLSSEPKILWSNAWEHLGRQHQLGIIPRCLNAVSSLDPDFSNQSEEEERKNQTSTHGQPIPHPSLTGTSLFIMYYRLPISTDTSS
jgi:hypothetical protein